MVVWMILGWLYQKAFENQIEIKIVRLEFVSRGSFEKGTKVFQVERDVHFYFYQKVHTMHFSKCRGDRKMHDLLENSGSGGFPVTTPILEQPKVVFNLKIN